MDVAGWVSTGAASWSAWGTVGCVGAGGGSVAWIGIVAGDVVAGCESVAGTGAVVVVGGVGCGKHSWPVVYGRSVGCTVGWDVISASAGPARTVSGAVAGSVTMVESDCSEVAG